VRFSCPGCSCANPLSAKARGRSCCAFDEDFLGWSGHPSLNQRRAVVVST
jgi:hypothetical protein